MLTMDDVRRLAVLQDEEVRKATEGADLLWDMFDAKGMSGRSQIWDTLFRRVTDLIAWYGGNASKRAMEWHSQVRPDSYGGYEPANAYLGAPMEPIYKSLQWACRPLDDDGPDGRERTKARVREVVERHVREAGQTSLRYNARHDPASKGWIVVPLDSKACAYCTLLAGRPEPYTSPDDAQSRHGGCRCQAVPVWRGEGLWLPGLSRRREMYRTVEAACGPDASMQVKAANMRRLYPADVTDPALGIPADSDFAKTVGIENVAKINGLLADTKHTMTAKLWVAHIDEYRFDKTDIKDGVAVYKPWSKKIDINLRRTTLGMDTHYPFQTLFHETAHALDRKMGNGTYFSKQYRDGNGRSFADVLRLDAQDAINDVERRHWASDKAKLKRMAESMDDGRGISSEDRDWLERFGLLAGGRESLQQAAQAARMPRVMAYRHLADEIHDGRLPADCDVENVFHFAFGDEFHDFQTMAHPAGYYTGTHGENKHSIEPEAFAEMMSAQIADEKAWATFVKYCPRGYRMYENMVRELWKKVQNV